MSSCTPECTCEGSNVEPFNFLSSCVVDAVHVFNVRYGFERDQHQCDGLDSRHRSTSSTSIAPQHTLHTLSNSEQAEHAVVEEVKLVASQVQKNNSADLKNIVSNVSKEAVAAKAEDNTTFAEKVEEGIKEVAKDAVIGAESAGKEVEAHPELIAE